MYVWVRVKCGQAQNTVQSIHHDVQKRLIFILLLCTEQNANIF